MYTCNTLGNSNIILKVRERCEAYYIDQAQVHREYSRLHLGERGAQAADRRLKGRVLARAQQYSGPRQSKVQRRLAVCYAGGCYLPITGMQLDGTPRLHPKHQLLHNERLLQCSSRLGGNEGTGNA